MSQIRRAGLSACLILVWLSAAAGQQYTFTTIDVPGAGFTTVQGINTAGDMVGYYGKNSDSGNGFLLRNGIFTLFDYPGAASTRATGINDSGLMIGHTVGTLEQCFTYDGETFKGFHDGNNSATVCYGINNSMFVVGGAGSINSTRGFELRGHRFQNVSPPGIFTYIYDTGINNLGVVVGFTSATHIDAFAFSHGIFTNINFPGATGTEAHGVNDAGTVVGWYSSGASVFGFTLSDGLYSSLSYPGAVYTAPQGINSVGQIVGSYSTDSITWHGFVASPNALPRQPE